MILNFSVISWAGPQKYQNQKQKQPNGARLNFKPLSLNDTIKRMKQQYLQVIYLIRD